MDRVKYSNSHNWVDSNPRITLQRYQHVHLILTEAQRSEIEHCTPSHRGPSVPVSWLQKKENTGDYWSDHVELSKAGCDQRMTK
jgi:hypothetical protein